MATYPNGGLITETNAQYYSGQQGFPALSAVAGTPVTISGWNLTTPAVSGYDAAGNVAGNPYINFDVYYAPIATPTTYVKIAEELVYISNIENSTIEVRTSLTHDPYNGNFYTQLREWATEDNYGSYEYIRLSDVIDNFLVAYVGEQKLISRATRTDVMFHAKRGLQEFSYDTLRSIKSQELTIPPHLSVPIPQDYVNYVKVSWIDNAGVKRIIYPAEPGLTSNPTELPIQDSDGIPTQDGYPTYESNLLAKQSFTEERWASFDDNNIIGDWNLAELGVYDWQFWKVFYGQRYGLDPSLSQANGWYTINRRTGKFSFSSNLRGKLIILEYISDGLGYDEDMKIPKFAEEAIYMHIAHAILSIKMGIPEYVVRRYRNARSSALRNAKIRLSNIKLEEFTQIMRNKSKWIKH
tara:strand:- start:2422 stop:3651 length:1230 start_codon:yes stop_codon:yes gene_type:complete